MAHSTNQELELSNLLNPLEMEGAQRRRFSRGKVFLCSALAFVVLLGLLTFLFVSTAYFPEEEPRYPSAVGDRYVWDEGFGIQMPFFRSRTVAVHPETGNIYASEGAEHDQIYVFSHEGEFLDSWGDIGMQSCHSLVFHQDSLGVLSLWAVDLIASTIYQFNAEDRSVMGTLQQWTNPETGEIIQLDGPTDLVFDAAGNLFVADGGECSSNEECQPQILKYSALSHEAVWAQTGYLERPHTISYDEEYDRVVVGDPREHRVSFLSGETGDYLGHFDCTTTSGFQPLGVRVVPNTRDLVVIDAGTAIQDDVVNYFLVLELPGEEVEDGACPIVQMTDIAVDVFAHLATVDNEGNIWLNHYTGRPAYINRWIRTEAL